MNHQAFRFHVQLVLISHFLILIGAGHGLACVGLFQLVAFPNFNQEGFTVNWHAGYDDSIPFVGLLATVADILIIISMYLKHWSQSLLLITGQLLQLAAFLYLTHDFRTDATAKLSLISAIPWLILMVLLCLHMYIRHVKHKQLSAT